MKIILTFPDEYAARLRWLLAARYKTPKAGLKTLAKKAIMEMASEQAIAMVAEIDKELQAEFAKNEIK